MNDLIVAEKIAQWHRLKALVLDSVSSPITKRVYSMALDEFLTWFRQEPRPGGFCKATVSAWRASLEVRRLGSSSVIIRMSAIRKLAAEAADNGLIDPKLAAGISRVKSAKSVGVRTGNWLSVRQAQNLLNAPDTRTLKGLRDRAILAVLLGCGLRRSEVAALTFSHLQQRDGRWCIVDLVGKHGRIRTTPMPNWVKVAIDAWTELAAISKDHVFRPVRRVDRVIGERLGEKAVWQMLREYAAQLGIPGLAPHDLRRTCAKLCRAAGGELEQIQMLLGHDSVQTTERYLGTKQDLVDAPNDAIKLIVVQRPNDAHPECRCGQQSRPLRAADGRQKWNRGFWRFGHPLFRRDSPARLVANYSSSAYNLPHPIAPELFGQVLAGGVEPREAMCVGPGIER